MLRRTWKPHDYRRHLGCILPRVPAKNRADRAHLALNQGMRDDPLAAVTCDEGAAAPAGSVWMGVFACCPEEQAGATATFHRFEIRSGTTFEHNADGNHA